MIHGIEDGKLRVEFQPIRDMVCCLCKKAAQIRMEVKLGQGSTNNYCISCFRTLVSVEKGDQLLEEMGLEYVEKYLEWRLK